MQERQLRERCVRREYSIGEVLSDNQSLQLFQTYSIGDAKIARASPPESDAPAITTAAIGASR